MEYITDMYVTAPQPNEIKAGNYILSVAKMYDCPDRQYVKLVYDIAEGQYAGFYANNNNDNAHAIYLSYKSRFAREFAIQNLDAITRSNPGFNASMAWNDICSKGGKDFSVFIGKVFGAEIAEEHYTVNGEERSGMKPKTITVADYIRNGSFKGGR